MFNNLICYAHTGDVAVDLSMNYATAITATMLSSHIGGAIGAIVIVSGAGTAIGIVADAVIGGEIYLVTDVITIDDKTIREHVKASFDKVLGE